MELCIPVSTTKVLVCISENITSTIPRATGFLVRFLDYLYPRKSIQRILGEFNPGEQPLGTCITAEAVHGGDVDIIVSWKDGHGHLVSSSRSKTLGWDRPKRARECEPLDGRD